MDIEDYIISFPHIAEQIFYSLDIKSLQKCRGVKKSWREFIDSGNFLQNQSERDVIENIRSLPIEERKARCRKSHEIMASTVFGYDFMNEDLKILLDLDTEQLLEKYIVTTELICFDVKDYVEKNIHSVPIEERRARYRNIKSIMAGTVSYYYPKNDYFEILWGVGAEQLLETYIVTTGLIYFEVKDQVDREIKNKNDHCKNAVEERA